MINRQSLLLLGLIFVSLAAGACFSPANERAILKIDNESGESIDLKGVDLGGLPRVSVATTEKDGETSRYEGVELVEVLNSVNAPLGEQLRREKMTARVIVEGTDGYKVTFTMAELDPDFSGTKVVLADTRNGLKLSEDEGPLRLIVPTETNRQARWVRNVTKLSIKTSE